MCFVAAAEDTVIRNDYIEEYANLSQSPETEFHYLEGADHTNLHFDVEHASRFIRLSIDFMDKVTD